MGTSNSRGCLAQAPKEEPAGASDSNLQATGAEGQPANAPATAKSEASSPKTSSEHQVNKDSPYMDPSEEAFRMLKAQTEENQKAIQTLQQQVQLGQVEREVLLERLAASQAELAQYSEASRKVEADLNELKQPLPSKGRADSPSRAELERKNSEILDLQEEMLRSPRSERRAMRQKIDALEATQSELRTQLDMEPAHLKKCLSELEAKLADVPALKDRINELEQVNSRLMSMYEKVAR